MTYQCEAISVDAFLSQLVRYVASGHYFYLTAKIPEGKDPRRVDEKLIARYGIDRPRWKRQRRNLKDNAGIHYLRHDRFFVILLTKGRHERFYTDHGPPVRDIRRTALKYHGYSVRYTYSEEARKHRVFVRLDKETYRNLKAHFLTLATQARYHASSSLEAEFARLPYQAFAPVVNQLGSILRSVNRHRRRSGLRPLSEQCLPKRRRLTRVFMEGEMKKEQVLFDEAA